MVFNLNDLSRMTNVTVYKSANVSKFVIRPILVVRIDVEDY
jgi:hypothetical protein